MNIKKIAKIAGIGITVVILVIFGVMGFIMFDVMSYTANGSETFNPSGNVIGNALVVYDPGISGEAGTVALNIAKELQKKGYEVDYVGINNKQAKNTSKYDLIVVGGPIYAGKASSSVRSYLSNLKPANGTKVAVFATGQDKDIMRNLSLLKSEVAPVSGNNQLKIDAVGKFITGENNNQNITVFVGTFS